MNFRRVELQGNQGMNLRDLVGVAFCLAKAACDEWVAKHGDVDACGFAWVELPIKGQSELANLLLKEFGANKNVGRPGIRVSSNRMTGNWYGQSMGAKEAASEAFTSVLVKAGYKATACARMD